MALHSQMLFVCGNQYGKEWGLGEFEAICVTPLWCGEWLGQNHCFDEERGILELQLLTYNKTSGFWNIHIIPHSLFCPVPSCGHRSPIMFSSVVSNVCCCIDDFSECICALKSTVLCHHLVYMNLIFSQYSIFWAF